MLPGLFGFSLIFELVVLYYALNLWLTNVDKRWAYLVLILVALLHWSDSSDAVWAGVFSGQYDIFWREILSNFGFR